MLVVEYNLEMTCERTTVFYRTALVSQTEWTASKGYWTCDARLVMIVDSSWTRSKNERKRIGVPKTRRSYYVIVVYCQTPRIFLNATSIENLALWFCFTPPLRFSRTYSSTGPRLRWDGAFIQNERKLCGAWNWVIRPLLTGYRGGSGEALLYPRDAMKTHGSGL